MPSVRVRRVPGAPVVSIRVWLPGGSTREAHAGQAHAAGRLLVEGTSDRDWRRIAEQAEARGIGIAADAGYEAQGLAIDALADEWELALSWAAELVLDSTFPEDRCRWIAEQAAAELEQLADHPEVKTSWAFARQLYGSAARGRPLLGTAEGLATLDPAACESFHRSCLEGGAIVTVAGDISEVEVDRRAGELFGGLGSPDLSGDPDSPRESPDAYQRIELEDSEQAHWMGGAVTVGRAEPDFWTLQLLGVVLGSGAGLTGRIPRRIRELEGLAYSCTVATASGAGRGAGCLEIAVGTARHRLEAVGRAVVDELGALVRDGVTGEELEEARAYALGREPFERETARQWATLLAQSELFGVRLEDPAWVRARWRELSASDLLTAARRYLEPERLKVTVGR